VTVFHELLFNEIFYLIIYVTFVTILCNSTFVSRTRRKHRKNVKVYFVLNAECKENVKLYCVYDALYRQKLADVGT
jgi:hypothetical protein